MSMVFIRDIMIMRMGMCDRMRVRRTVVCMGERMRMNMDVISYQRIHDDRQCSEDHDSKRAGFSSDALVFESWIGLNASDDPGEKPGFSKSI